MNIFHLRHPQQPQAPSLPMSVSVDVRFLSFTFFIGGDSGWSWLGCSGGCMHGGCTV